MHNIIRNIIEIVKGHTGRGTRRAMGQHAVNILDREKERRTMELQSRCEKSLHYWVHMSALLGPHGIHGIGVRRYLHTGHNP
jgi:hypothetical protein